ncbi:MAG: type II toxin-antitoxin system RelE/ParE family toxin [Gammaproteobacteria bacterium]|nr:type II toxin-antitoxin system RelE/ParE family toxin [Gammaproteobacteria bacterium]
MTKAFVLTRKAVADLKAIAIYTEERWGRDQRNWYIKQLDDAFRLLAGTPLAGKDCTDLRSGYRKFPQGSHIIFYRSGADGIIEIVRILHKNMDVAATLTGD